MPVTTYSNIPVAVKMPTSSNFYLAPASNVSISIQNKLEASRILAPNQNNNFRIGGELSAKISVTFMACNQNSQANAANTWNLASGVLQDLTGNVSTDISIGDTGSQGKFLLCYLEGASVDITPFGPVVVTADFSCLNPPTGSSFAKSSGSYPDNLVSGIAYGFNTVITNGTTLSDSNRESISYKINCDRTYTTTIGQTTPSNIFLNGVEKELNIKSHNIGAYIDYTGYGEMITIDPRNASGQSIINGGFGMSANCKIMAQNLSVQEGDILAGDISLKEIIL